MSISTASKIVRSLLGLAVLVLLVVSSHQLAARSVADLAAAGAICALEYGGGRMTEDADCRYAETGHAHCLPHSGCSGFTLPVAQLLTPSPGSPRWVSPNVGSLVGRTIPLETPPPIAI